MKLIKSFFNNWLHPIFFFGLTLASLLVFIEKFKGNYYIQIVLLIFILFGFSLFCLFISSIYQLIKKRWLKSLITAFIGIAAILAFIFYLGFSFFVDTVSDDGFADNLTRPTNISINLPLDLAIRQARADSKIKVVHTDFQLYKSFQPGLYEYDFWTGFIEPGVIYLKVYEITNNIGLSADRLIKTTLVKVGNPTNSIMRFGTSNHFTIYEGDWGKPYAARFEVWYKPDSGGPERKLFEKNYQIEGWMR